MQGPWQHNAWSDLVQACIQAKEGVKKCFLGMMSELNLKESVGEDQVEAGI